MQIVGSIIVIGLIFLLLRTAYGDLRDKLRKRRINRKSGGKIIGNIGGRLRSTREDVDKKSKGKIIDIDQKRKAKMGR